MRPHLSCDFLTPVEAHKMNGELKKHWKKRKFQSKSENIGTEKTELSLQDIIPAYKDISSEIVPPQIPISLNLLNKSKLIYE